MPAAKRARLLWEPCAADETIESSTTFAEKLPKAYRTGIATIDQDRVLKRKAVQAIIRHLFVHEQHIFSCKSYLEGQAEADTLSIQTTGKFKNFGSFARLDEVWCVQYILGTSKLSMAALEKAKTYDEAAVQHIMTYKLAITAGVRLPDSCRDIAVATELFKHRERSLGCRTAEWTDNLVMSTGQIKWADRGVYKLLWNETNDRVTRVQHLPTKEIADIPAQAPIDSNFVLQSNYSDMEAFVVFRTISHSLASFFEKTKGPFASPLWNAKSAHLKESISAAAAVIEEKRLASVGAEVKESKGFFEEVKQQKRSVAAAKARAALQRKKSELNNKRKIAVAVATT